MRTLTNPSAGSTIVGTIKTFEGGTSQVTAPLSVASIGLVPVSAKGQINGVAPLDANGRMLTSHLPVDIFSSISVFGLLSVVKGTTNTYTIKNFDSFTDYVVTSDTGSVTRIEDTITFVAPLTPGPSGFNINGRNYVVTVTDIIPATPTITSPTAAAVLLTTNYTLTSSAFSDTVGLSTHSSSDWQIATDIAFNAIVKSVEFDASNKTSWAVTGLTDGTAYYARVRYRNNIGGVTPWSTGVLFQVAIPLPTTPSITSPSAGGSVSQTSVTFTSSAFAVQGSVSTHVSTDWQLSTSATFATLVDSQTNSTTNKTSWTFNGIVDNNTYYLRVRYKDSNGKTSAWSATTQFTSGFSFTYNPVIASTVYNYNMRADAIANGWDQVKPLKMTVTLTGSGIVAGNSSSVYAFRTGTGFPAGSDLRLVNNGSIVGSGGAGGSANFDGSYSAAAYTGSNGGNGGPALYAETALTVTNNTNIAGGGGGGGGGGSTQNQQGGGYYIGGNGGNGSSILAATGGSVGQTNNQDRGGGDGGAGGQWGSSGASGGSAFNGQGGAAIGLGGAGGAPGAAVIGNSNISWTAFGNRYGSIS